MKIMSCRKNEASRPKKSLISLKRVHETKGIDYNH